MKSTTIMKGLKPVAALISVFALNIASCAYFMEIPKSRALVVGLDAYVYANELSYSVADSEAIGNALNESGIEVVRLSATRTPTRTLVHKTDVLTKLTTAATDAPAGGWDTFFFYYAGHGYSPNGTLALSDAPSGDSITAAELLTAVAAVPARVRVVILDSCFSGNFVTEAPSVSPYPDDYTGTTVFSYPFSFTLIEKAASAFSAGSSGDIIVLSAAGASEPSEEIAGIRHGVFTAGLLVSAKNGDTNGDGIVTLTEAYNYAADYVQTVWNSLSSASNYYLPRLSGNALDVVLFRK